MSELGQLLSRGSSCRVNVCIDAARMGSRHRRASCPPTMGPRVNPTRSPSSLLFHSCGFCCSRHHQHHQSGPWGSAVTRTAWSCAWAPRITRELLGLHCLQSQRYQPAFPVPLVCMLHHPIRCYLCNTGSKIKWLRISRRCQPSMESCWEQVPCHCWRCMQASGCTSDLFTRQLVPICLFWFQMPSKQMGPETRTWVQVVSWEVIRGSTVTGWECEKGKWGKPTKVCQWLDCPMGNWGAMLLGWGAWGDYTEDTLNQPSIERPGSWVVFQFPFLTGWGSPVLLGHLPSLPPLPHAPWAKNALWQSHGKWRWCGSCLQMTSQWTHSDSRRAATSDTPAFSTYVLFIYPQACN